MPAYRSLHSIPCGTMLLIADEQELQRYIKAFGSTPQSLRPVVCDPKIGAYLRGLVVANKLPVEQSAQVAQVVLEVVTGLLAMDKLRSALRERLGVPAEKAEAMAREIEKELLAPVALELNAFLQEKAQGVNEGDPQVPTSAGSAGRGRPEDDSGIAAPAPEAQARKDGGVTGEAGGSFGSAQDDTTGKEGGEPASTPPPDNDDLAI